MTMMACLAVLTIVALMVLAGALRVRGTSLRAPPPGRWLRVVAVAPRPPRTHRAALATLGISRT